MIARYTLFFVFAVILTGTLANLLGHAIPVESAYLIGILNPLIMVGGAYLLIRIGWLPKPNTDTINEDSRQKFVLAMAIGLAIFLAALVGILRIENSARYMFIPVLAAGFFTMLFGSARLLVWVQATREKPELADERVTSNIRKADRWGLLAGIEAALILGLLDYTGTLPLSGATVGFSSAVFAILVGLSANLWLEWKDG